ncbi:TPA: helix-turn-helix transcriptional regulator [Pseudomonas aeruginosa]|nr:helix-turn-helix transcriptional regulator [Pseudomonas aeruginosa]HEJ4488768.1 helix-turn-helix transcriptional regulator [Pseudomonas aeruginosa]HEJ6090222.1 helix-turn-helix transcriptional regulator [Pseudomonas aeruginosa]
MAQRFNSKLDATMLGRRLRKARKSKGMTLTSAASAAGVHHSQLSRMERGEMITANNNLQKICKYFDEPYEKYLVPSSSLSLGERVDQLILDSPENEPALRRLVEALEALSIRP